MSLRKVCLTSQKINQKKSEQTKSKQIHKRTNQAIKRYRLVLKALEMLDKGLLTEKATLAVIGTHEDSYSVAPDVRIKVLELVENGKLSERGLVAILGV